MLYALLTSISAPHPTVTVAPTYFSVSIAENLTDLPMWIEIVGIAASVILGIVALLVSYNAYKFAKKQHKNEEDMRQREAKITVIDKSYDIFFFFTHEIYQFDFFNSDSNQISKFINRLFSIRFTAIMLFKDEIRITIEDSIFLLHDVSQSFNQGNSKKTEKDIIDSYQEIAERYKLETDDVIDKQAALNNVLSHIQNKIDNIYDKYRLNL